MKEQLTEYKQFGGWIIKIILSQRMRFQVVLKREKLKQVQSALTTAISIIKARPIENTVYLIYVATQNELRILIQNQLAPIVIVLTADLFQTITVTSKNQPNNVSLGFQFKYGLSFLQNLDLSIKENDNSSAISEQDKTLVLKILKDNQNRFLDIKLKNKLRREEIQKPNKHQNELFSYQWIDGVLNGKLSFEINPSNIIQIFKFVSKAKNSYPIQLLEEKKLLFIVDIKEEKVYLKLKAPTSQVEACTKMQKLSTEQRNSRYMYQIKIDDAENLMLAIKSQCEFVIDKQNNLAVVYAGNNYSSQISLKQWIIFIKIEGEEPQQVMLKTQN